MKAARVSRRSFLKISTLAGSGLVIGIRVPFETRAAAMTPTQFSAWLKIAPDDTVTILLGQAEMGQGVYTMLPMLVAEELEIDWSAVRVEQALADPVYTNVGFGTQATAGSSSVRVFQLPLRKAGAQAREMLRTAAAHRWNVPLAECAASNGRIVHQPTQRSLGYGALAASAANLAPPVNPPLKAAKDWKLLGKRVRRLDSACKVDGTAVYGIDVQVPGMLVATVRACPVFGGRLKALDDKPALAIAGVHSVVMLETAYLVLADGYWAAHKAAESLAPQWEPGPFGGFSSARLSAALADKVNNSGRRVLSAGDAAKALEDAKRAVEAIYEVPYLAHATMEPMNATVHMGADTSCRTHPTRARQAIRHLSRSRSRAYDIPGRRLRTPGRAGLRALCGERIQG
jgi:isoquinoline 1-oxidoreductase beta subunit